MSESEGSYLSEWMEFFDVEYEGRSSKIDISSLVNSRQRNMNSKVGDMISCPVCKSNFKKTTYNKIFCNSVPGKKNKKGNYRRRNSSSCKDKYWNIVDNKVRPF